MASRPRGKEALGRQSQSDVWVAGAGGDKREKEAWRRNGGPGSHLAPAASVARGCRVWRPRRTGHCGSSGCRRRGAPPQSLEVWGPSWRRTGTGGWAPIPGAEACPTASGRKHRLRLFGCNGYTGAERAGRSGARAGPARGLREPEAPSAHPSAHAQF